MNIHSEGWHRSHAGQAAQQDDLPSEFGVTLADAGRLLRRATRVWIMFPVSPDGMTAIFEVPRSSVLSEIKFYQGGTKTLRPSELSLSAEAVPTLIFGSTEANRRAAGLAEQPGASPHARG